MSSLREEIQTKLKDLFVDGDIDGSWGTPEKTEELIELFKKYALEMVGEDTPDNVQDGGEYYPGMNEAKQEIRERIEETK